MALATLPAAHEKRAYVRAMFDRIAPGYDRLNRLLTFGRDQRWRRAALDALAVQPGERVLDLACGTGDLAELAAQRGARVVGVDFAREMLRGARQRGVGAGLVQADGAALPLRTASVSHAVCGFAFRNFVSIPAVLAELARVIGPGGRLVVLEVDRPRARVLRAGHRVYFEHVVPLIGGILSDRAAYAYLPQSASYLPPTPDLFALFGAAGFTGLWRRPVFGGAIQILHAVRRPAA